MNISSGSGLRLTGGVEQGRRWKGWWEEREGGVVGGEGGMVGGTGGFAVVVSSCFSL